MTEISITPDPDNGQMLVNVTGVPGGILSGYVLRSDADGSRSTIRNAEPAVFAGGWTGVDRECPLDVTVSYQVTTTDKSNVLATSDLVLLPSLGQTWLKHPAQPSLDFKIPLVLTAPNWVRAKPEGVFYVEGRADPVITSSRRWKPTGSITVRTDTSEEASRMEAILDSGQVLLLQAPGEYGVGSVYVNVGEVPENRVSPMGWYAPRHWELPLTVTGRPVGTANASTGNTYADMAAWYATYADVAAEKGSYWELAQHVAPDL